MKGRFIIIVFFTLLHCFISYGQFSSIDLYNQDRISSKVSNGKSLLEANEIEEAVNYFIEAIELAKKRPEDSRAALFVSDPIIYQAISGFYYSTAKKEIAREYLEYYLSFNMTFLNAMLKNEEISVSDFNEQVLVRYLQIISMSRNGSDFEYAVQYAYRTEEEGAKLLGNNTSDYASVLDVLAVTLEKSGEYNLALDYSNKSLSIKRLTIGEETVSYATTLANISSIYSELGRFDEALDFSLKALDIRKRVEGETSDNYITSVNNTGNYYHELGDYIHALEYLKNAQDLTAKTLGKENNEYASSLNNLANVYVSTGDYKTAMNLFSEALSIRKRVVGEKSADYLTTLGNIAICYSEMGDYAKALEYYQKILNSYEETIGRQHPNYAITLNNMANCYDAIGDPRRSLQYQLEACEIRKNTLGENHPYYASDLNNIGICYSQLGDQDSAIEYMTKALDIIERSFGQAFPLYSQILSNLPQCFFAKQDYDTAYSYCLKAQDAIGRVLGKTHPTYAIVLTNIGQYYLIKKDFDRAIDCYLEALDIRQTRIGRCSSETVDCLNQLASLYYNAGNREESEKFFLMSQSCMQELVAKVFSTVGEKQRELFWGRYSHYYPGFIYSYAGILNTPSMNAVAYDCALMSKGILMNTETSMRELIQESRDEECVALYDKVIQEKKLYDQLKQTVSDNTRALDSLSVCIENDERELAKRSSVYGDYTNDIRMGWEDVRKSLKPNTIAIEFVSFNQADTTYYAALTLRDNYSSPHLVTLFTQEDLDRISPKAYYKSTDLTELVWSNLQDELNGVKDVFFSAVGDLNNIAIESLVSLDGDRRLSEDRNYHRVSSTRIIPKMGAISNNKSAILYGGIRYDVSGKEDSPSGNEDVARAIPDIIELQRYRKGVEYLPSTKKEVDNISSLLTKHHIQSKVLSDGAGTESSFKQISGGQVNIIHIATHGFYWTERELEKRIEAGQIRGLEGNGEYDLLKEDKALTRSGLLFAGADITLSGARPLSSIDDGILNAKEIAHLDLRNTDLVVLSACQSALGELSGDGVLGLQRGFKKAGVKTMIMTLWEVDDEATMIFMEHFYSELMKGKDKTSAFVKAQRYLQSYSKNGKDYSEPYYWAAFIMLD